MQSLLEDFEKNETKALEGKYLIFTLKDKNYGLSIQAINEIIELPKITPVPKSPPALKGIINLRGSIIPVIDLRIKLEMREKEYDEQTCIIIINSSTSPNNHFGLIVDMVSEVIYLAEADISPPLKYDLEENSNLYDGIGTFKDNIIMLFNIQSIVGF